MREQSDDVKADSAPVAEELHAAEQIVARLILAAKNLNLYPQHHTIARQSIQELQEQLHAFISRYGEIALEVFKTRMEYRGYNVLPGTGAKENLAYLCYRDGIQWLTFSEGITFAELKGFLQIVNTHQVMEEENQGDMVTDLWDAGFFHIRYSTNNRIWENEPLLDLASLKVQRPDDSAESGVAADATQSISDFDCQLWQLHPEEIEKTRRMVSREENREFNQDVFDVLLVILNEQQDREDFSAVLDLIHECFVNAVSRGQFRRVRNFLKEFYATREAYKADRHWALAYLDDFLRMIAGPRGLSCLKDRLPTIDSGDLEQIEEVKQMLALLPPESILFLGSILPTLHAKGVCQAVASVLGDLAAQDLRPLAHLVRNSDTAVATRAIMILPQVRAPFKDVLPLILESGRSKNDTIRKTAVSALIQYNDPGVYPHLLPFFSDRNEKIRQMVFQFFSRRRHPDAETVLVDRISRKDFTRKQAGLLYMLYRALGSCGSRQSLDFLHTQLFARPWRMGKLCGLHRAGAAMAMYRLEAPEADTLIARASRTFWPTIRRALQRAKEDSHGA